MLGNIKIEDITGLDFKGFYKIIIFILVFITIIFSGLLILFVFLKELFIDLSLPKLILLGFSFSIPGYFLILTIQIRPFIKNIKSNVEKIRNEINDRKEYLEKIKVYFNLKKNSSKGMDFLDLSNNESLFKLTRKKIELSNKDDDFLNQILNNKTKNKLDADDRHKMIIELYKYRKEMLKYREKEISKQENKIYEIYMIKGLGFYLIQLYFSLILSVFIFNDNISMFLIIFVITVISISLIISWFK